MMHEKDVQLESSLEAYAGLPVLVLGASGFIGRWVARRLTEARAKLYLPARDCSAAKQTFLQYGVKGRTCKVDVLNSGLLARLIGEIDPVVTFNLAGYGIDRSETSEDLSYRINAQLPATVCDAMAATTPVDSWTGQRVVHVGTAMEYGDVSGDLSENSQVRPTTLYGKSKLAGTEAVSSSCKTKSLPGITARLFAVYGPGESQHRLLPTLSAAAQQTGFVKLTAGLHKRDFCYVEDVAEALLRLGVSECRPGAVVNVATGTLTSIRSFVETAAEILNLEKSRLDFGVLPTRVEEMDHDPVSTSKLLKLTGWRPETQVLEGILKTIAFERLNEGVHKNTKVRQKVCELF